MRARARCAPPRSRGRGSRAWLFGSEGRSASCAEVVKVHPLPESKSRLGDLPRVRAGVASARRQAPAAAGEHRLRTICSSRRPVAHAGKMVRRHTSHLENSSSRAWRGRRRRLVACTLLSKHARGCGGARRAVYRSPRASRNQGGAETAARFIPDLRVAYIRDYDEPSCSPSRSRRRRGVAGVPLIQKSSNASGISMPRWSAR